MSRAHGTRGRVRWPQSAAFVGSLLLTACGAATNVELPARPAARATPAVEPLPTAYHRAAEDRAAARVRDPDRGGPTPRSDASPLPPFLGVSRATARYVGAPVCAACHGDAASAYAKTKHAHARDALVAASAAANPACLGCHVTGFGHPGGWAGPASLAGLDAVGCEACHGPGSDHAQAGGAPGYGQLPRDASACVACHTYDASPDFRFEDRWPRVAHGAAEER